MASPRTRKSNARRPRTSSGDGTGKSAAQLFGVVSAAAAGSDLPDLPAGLTLLRHREIAGLVAPAPTAPARQVRGALLSYTELLDRLAAPGPVLPVRFGTTLPSMAAIEHEVLRPHHDAFAGTLAALTGRAQYTLRARYRTDAVIREVLQDRPEAAQLHREAADPAARAQLGELVARSVAAKRAADSEILAHLAGRHAVAVVVQQPDTLDLERLADIAYLVEHRRRADFEDVVGDIAGKWRDRAQLRLLGPMAPYHFVGDPAAGQRGGW